MKQEYILLKKNNDLLNSLIGNSFNQKSKDEAYKILCEIHEIADKRSMEKCLVYCTDLNQNEILGVGGSSLMKDKNGKIISDLINDNMGIWWAGYHRLKNTLALQKTLLPETGVPTLENIYKVGGTGLATTTGGAFQIGSGLTPPARLDFKTENPFVSAPESLITSEVGNGVYSSATGRIIGIATQISPTTGSGTINESCFFQVLNSKNYLISRDSISPAVTFTPAKTITIDYTWQL